jgi:Na+/H+-dicarboxylate symporter
MSSAATLPLSIAAAENNTGRPEAARVIIPATLSIHLIGDALCVPVLSLLVMVSFGHALPSMVEFMIFAAYMVLAKFAVAAIPGGGILVILPLLEAHLAFTPEMSALILALYMLFDPLITATNVSGNGAFVIFLSRFMPAAVASQGQKPSLSPR